VEFTERRRKYLEFCGENLPRKKKKKEEKRKDTSWIAGERNIKGGGEGWLVRYFQYLLRKVREG